MDTRDVSTAGFAERMRIYNTENIPIKTLKWAKTKAVIN